MRGKRCGASLCGVNCRIIYIYDYNMVKDEIFPLVNELGEVVGQATRRECHSGSKLLHPVVHLHVRDAEGRLFLQKRSMTKDIQPGKWDTAVGGHIDFGETVHDALLREAREELGLTGFTPEPLFSYVHESDIERELVNAFTAVVDESMIVIYPVEIDEGRFWTLPEIDANIGKGVFTPNFESEYLKLRALWG